MKPHLASIIVMNNVVNPKSSSFVSDAALHGEGGKMNPISLRSRKEYKKANPTDVGRRNRNRSST